MCSLRDKAVAVRPAKKMNFGLMFHPKRQEMCRIASYLLRSRTRISDSPRRRMLGRVLLRVGEGQSQVEFLIEGESPYRPRPAGFVLNPGRSARIAGGRRWWRTLWTLGARDARTCWRRWASSSERKSSRRITGHSPDSAWSRETSGELEGEGCQPLFAAASRR